MELLLKVIYPKPVKKKNALQEAGLDVQMCMDCIAFV